MADPNLQQELAKKQTIEDIYEFCLSISDGYTMEEFQAYLKDLIKMVGGMSEEQLEKVSGGAKWNNKALSAVLATMSLASPLAGAAGSVQETTDQSQPSAISSFAGKVKKAVKDNPITYALNGTVVAGLGVLALLKGHRNSDQAHSDPAQSRTLSSNSHSDHSVSSAVPPILSDIPSSLSNFRNVVQKFNTLNDLYKNKSPAELRQFCFTHTSGFYYLTASDHVNIVFDILFPLTGATNSYVEHVSFDTIQTTIHDNKTNKDEHIYKHIDDKSVLLLDTSNIENLNNLVIRSTNSRLPKYGYQVLNLDNYQKAVVIRYVQAKYAQDHKWGT